MNMLLMGACLSLFGLAVACVTFHAATRQEIEPGKNDNENSID